MLTWSGERQERGKQSMFIESQAADPAVHNLCVAIARRCVSIIRPLLRPEEVGEALTEFYRAARIEIEKKPGREAEV